MFRYLFWIRSSVLSFGNDRSCLSAFFGFTRMVTRSSYIAYKADHTNTCTFLAFFRATTPLPLLAVTAV